MALRTSSQSVLYTRDGGSKSKLNQGLDSIRNLEVWRGEKSKCLHLQACILPVADPPLAAPKPKAKDGIFIYKKDSKNKRERSKECLVEKLGIMMFVGEEGGV